jgi:RNA polymerase sigma-70 factor, ECF subfamily
VRSSGSAAEDRLKAVIDEHRRVVLAHALLLTRGDEAWAEDVVQETFLRAWRHWERLTPERGSVRGWLLRVAHNLVMDEYRSARRRHGEVPLTPGDDVAGPERTDQVLLAQVVRQALGQLPRQHREALEATYLCDQTAAQAARRLNIPIGTVKSRVHYGLHMLRHNSLVMAR